MRLSNEIESSVEMVIEHAGKPPRLNNRVADSKGELQKYFIFLIVVLSILIATSEVVQIKKY